MKMVNGIYQYTESGLDNVFLASGYSFKGNSRQGRSVVIHDIDGLHEAIGRVLIEDRKILAGQEIRFLRHELGMSQSTLAQMLDVTEQTVRRWEQDKLPIPRTADATIRSIYAEHVGGNSKMSEILQRIADLEDDIDRKMMLEADDDEWVPAQKVA
jgi:putative transcriptional regulator